jgi:sugar porter (SP) family MFS transporter
MLLASRLLLGVGLGIDISTINVYAAECAPAYIRGGLAVSWQMFTAFGVFLGFVANVAVYDVESPWKMQLAFPSIPVIPLALLIFLCPESPAWLTKGGGHYHDAFHSLIQLRNTELQAAKELYTLYLQASDAQTLKARPTFPRKLLELFTIPRIRRATLAAFVVMISQQLCGINIIAFYSSTIFLNAGFSSFHALLASTMFGFINFIGAFPAIWTMDLFGRRSLLLLTLPFMAVSMLATSLSFSLPEDNTARFGFLASMIYLFCAEYSPGMGPVPAPYSAEVFPLSHREIGMSFAVSVASIFAATLSLTFPRILALLRPQGAFALYAGLNVLAFVLVFLFVPETRMKTLEELDEVFNVPTRRFMCYQTKEYAPWFVRRYLLGRKEAHLRSLEPLADYNLLQQEDIAKD